VWCNFIGLDYFGVESYVSEVMHGKADGSEGSTHSSSRSNTGIAKFRSAEVSAPYVLACGTEASEMPIKLGIEFYI
jgi:hypothetical protein